MPAFKTFGQKSKPPVPIRKGDNTIVTVHTAEAIRGGLKSVAKRIKKRGALLANERL